MSAAKNSYNTFCRHLGTKGLKRRHVIGIDSGFLQSRSLCSVEELAPKLNLREVSDKTSNQGHTGTFSALQTGGRSFSPNAKLKPVLEQAGFTIFQSVSDLGFYGWTPRGSYRILSATTAEDFKEAIDLQARPKQITDAQAIRLKLPIHFEHLAPDEHENRYPYSQYEVASVYVTLKDRQIAKNSIDFCFGGSTLEMLANQRIQNNEMFLVTIVPGTGIILVTRRCDYIQNNSAFGFQFERVATGGECADQANAGFINHLQVMKIAGHNVLFSAEADAVDANGDSVEIKASDARYWGTKTMFQMISNGSLSVFQGIRSQLKLLDICVVSLARVTSDALSGTNLDTLERNIKSGMDQLVKEAFACGVKEGTVRAISFVGTSLTLVDSFDQGNFGSILPPEEVVKSLLD